MQGDEDEAVDPIAEACRQETAKLHAGDPENVRLWQLFMPSCLEEIDRIYRRLDIHFDYTHGESFYNPMLPDVVRDLAAKGIAQPSEGAVAIFFEEGEPPALIRKRDGAFTYTTSDLATIRYRMEQWHPERHFVCGRFPAVVALQEPVRGGPALGLRSGGVAAHLVRLSHRARSTTDQDTRGRSH